MRELNQRDGLTFVLVTHDPGVGDRCDRIVRMRDGQIVGEAGRSRAGRRRRPSRARPTGEPVAASLARRSPIASRPPVDTVPVVRSASTAH